MSPTDASQNIPPPAPKPGDCTGEPIAECTAYCNQQGSYSASGIQSYTAGCSQPCSITCKDEGVVRGPSATCSDSPWTECSEDCSQTREIGRLDGSNCLHDKNTRKCYTGACPTKAGDYLVFIDMKVKRLSPDNWGYAYAETFINALGKMFDLTEDNIEILSEVGAQMSSSIKLHFQLRLSLNDYKDSDNNGISDLYDAAQAIPEIVNSDYFSSMFLTQLKASSKAMDKIDYDRYGWLKPEDIEVINSMALPLGTERDPVDIPEDGDSPVDESQASSSSHEWFSTNEELFLLGVALTAVLLLLVILCLYFRLQSEHAALSKDKLSGFSLREIWSRFNNERRYRGGGGGIGKSGSRVYDRLRQTEMELSSVPMMDNQLDGDDFNGMH